MGVPESFLIESLIPVILRSDFEAMKCIYLSRKFH